MPNKYSCRAGHGAVEVVMPRNLLTQLSCAIAIAGWVAAGSAQTPTPSPSPSPAPSPTPVTRSVPASKDELSAITARGKALAEYDETAWHATDAAVATFQSMTTEGFYVADKVKGKWVVSFGRFNGAARDEFHVLVEAVQKGKIDFAITRHDTPKVETGRVLNLARAVALCRDQFTGQQRPYNIAVLPGPKDTYWVYVLPAQTTAGVYPVGGDVRYSVSGDGKTILETHPMHTSIQEFKGAPLVSGRPAALVRTAVLDDAPEDSDVFFAMTYQPSCPQFIVTRNFVYQLLATGQVVYLMKTADFVKK